MADLLLANISPNKISLPQGQSYTERKYLSALSFNHFWVCARSWGWISFPVELHYGTVLGNVVGSFIAYYEVA